MGNDGGSIVRRADIVKTKAKVQTVDKRNAALAVWFTCALSKLPLSPPIVSCPLGKLYNKDALLEYLISPPGTTDENGGKGGAYGADGVLVASHIRSLRDVVELVLTPNTEGTANAVAAEAGVEDSFGAAKFMCPLSQRPMNGSTRFVYVRQCGCVVNEAALKQLETAEKATATGSVSGSCRVCGKARPAGQAEMLVTINPTGEEAEKMKAAWATTRTLEAEAKAAKKAAKKRKAPVDGAEEPVAKAVKTATEPFRPSGPKLPPMVAAATAQAAAKAASSPAIASLYAKKGQSEQDRNWMTRGTFSRYA